MEWKLPGKQDVYLEIVERYKRYIELGIIKNGEKLPSVRAAAGEMSVNPNTVAKAYSILEDEGYVCSIPKKGAFVTFDGKPKDEKPFKEEREAIRSIKNSGIDKNTLLDIIEEVYSND